ncbi:MAG: c-type cytochrome [Gemmataceae bacterium]|nr:c-type cytochrome [Gemmataceae bacterium]
MQRLLNTLAFLLFAGCFAGLCAVCQEQAKGLANPGPLSAKDELGTFQIEPGFKISLACQEPLVIDPVACAEDHRGRLFVAEMSGYPNGGVGTGEVNSGRIRLLEDKDADGFYETSSVFASNLRLPTGVFPWKDGLLVANAPDLLFLRDTNGDGVADERKVLYTGFHTYNIQQMLNSFRWGLDNTVHAVAGSDGGSITDPGNVKWGPVPLRGRGIRFRPDVPGSLEPVSGGGQYGLTMDTQGHWFTATNSNHLRAIVIPDEYLRRNPFLPASTVALDIPEHGSACKVFRISPFEAWRVERTSRRKGSADAKRFASTELVPGGFSTSSCSPLLLNTEAVPPEFQNSIIICEPANNLLLRDVIEPKGVTFSSKRGNPNREFLASTDNWFRPVHLNFCLDGSILLLDFYREVIETPLSLPDDMKKVLPLHTQGKGRIWRITPDKNPKAKPFPHLAGEGKSLAQELESPNPARRILAQQLLVEQNRQDALDVLKQIARGSSREYARIHSYCTLAGLGAMDEALIIQALADPSLAVRCQGIRLSEKHLATSEKVALRVGQLADDDSLQVRFQTALSLGSMKPTQATPYLKKIALRDGADRWMQTAILSSSAGTGVDLLHALLTDADFKTAGVPGAEVFLSRLGASAGATLTEAELAQTLARVVGLEGSLASQSLVLQGIAQGYSSSGRDFHSLWEKGLSSPARQVLEKFVPQFKRTLELAKSEKQTVPRRVEAVRFLAWGPFPLIANAAPDLLSAKAPPAVQTAALQALTLFNKREVGDIVLTAWAGLSPTLRREALEVLFARTERIGALVLAMEKGTLPPSQVDPPRLEQLKLLKDPVLKEKVARLLSSGIASPRKQIVDAYLKGKEEKGDVAKGRALFQKNCATCHRLDGIGFQVGPDLLAAIRGKGRDYLLTSLLDPSREVDPRYVNYLLETRQGRTFSGIISAETGTAITLRRGDNAEDTILRNQVELIQNTSKSLMPDGLETQLSPGEMAHLLAFLGQFTGMP